MVQNKVQMSVCLSVVKEFKWYHITFWIRISLPGTVRHRERLQNRVSDLIRLENYTPRETEKSGSGNDQNGTKNIRPVSAPKQLKVSARLYAQISREARKLIQMYDH